FFKNNMHIFLVPMLQRGNAVCDALRHGTQSVPV
ncbi:MAG: DUF1534 domain-containing protein, partial [Methyloprofundus sp.]|nr:DUF1534 domain-containing protein [Methyloprofundus sp.]